MMLLSKMNWDKMNGLIPAVVQHVDSRDILMLGYMNRAALEATLRSGKVTFFSRSKDRLWTKGEKSGAFLQFIDAREDCDQDALLITARPLGPTCHTGNASCFDRAEAPPGCGFLGLLDQLVKDRKDLMPEGSYTTKLFTSGINRMAQKVGEESVEVVIAAKDEDQVAYLNEAADLIFHLLVLTHARGADLNAIVAILKERHAKGQGKK